jgi:hypothetical protein
VARQEPRLIRKYLDFRFGEFQLFLTRALADPELAPGEPFVCDHNLFSAVGEARTLWARALRLTAAERTILLEGGK